MKMKQFNRLLLISAAATLWLPSAAAAAPGFDQIGKATVKEIGSPAMVPVFGSQIPDGVYEVDVQTSSSFFRVEKVELTVDHGQMSALMYMYSGSYSHVYPGTAEQAAAADESEYIASEDINYYDTFTIPVEALDKPLPCAAFSKKKQKWYDRNLIFMASSLPEGTLPFDLPDYTLINKALAEYEFVHPEEFIEKETEGTSEGSQTAPAIDEEPAGVSLDHPDGEYSIEVSLSGGSGRASVTSPTWLYIRDGEAYAKLLWSSTYYDYMILDGVRYLNETTDGSNSTFTIPITAADEPIPVIADTTAMGDPVEIDYTLTFYADTVGSKSSVPQEGAKRVVLIAVIFMVAGGILNHFLKKRRR